VIYLDSCAIIKLVVPEAESVALADYLDTLTEPLATSELSTVEVHRQLIRIGDDEQLHAVADAVLAGLIPLALAPVIATAARLPGQHLRSLDALHLATAYQFAQPLSAFITYDKRLGEAATAAGLTVTGPA
jgi:predicted nucleic acid-binding protein